MSKPHQPILKRYDSVEAKHGYVRDLFNRGAKHYDRVCQVGFLGTGGTYRRRALRGAGLEKGMRVLDVACGTGAVTRAILEVIGADGSVIGVDPSEGMLDVAREEVAAEFRVGRAEQLPVEDEGFDFLSMGYALRHVEDLGTAFAEYHRVLKTDGKLLILEISRPRTAAGMNLAKAYFGHVMPWISAAVTGSGDAREMMAYYWETIEACVPPESILDALDQAGFREVERRVVGGIFSEYMAVK